MLADIIHGDRRASQRYECQLELWFEHHDRRGVRQLGHGVTADLSRAAIRFITETPPCTGATVVLHVSWPFLLQNVCPLELILTGSVDHVTERGAILMIRGYEFKTCGERSFEEPPPQTSKFRVA
jgi:hypothetical protein